MTTLVIGIVGVLAYVYFGAQGARVPRAPRLRGRAVRACSSVKNVVIAALVLFLVYQFATYKGLPNVLIVMAMLIALFVFVTKRMTIGRRIYAMGGNAKAAKLSGIKTERLTFFVFVNMGVLRRLAGLIIAARLNPATPKAGARLRARRHRRRASSAAPRRSAASARSSARSSAPSSWA